MKENDYVTEITKEVPAEVAAEARAAEAALHEEMVAGRLQPPTGQNIIIKPPPEVYEGPLHGCMDGFVPIVFPEGTIIIPTIINIT